MTLNLFLLLNFTGLVPVAILRTILHKYDLMMTQVSWPVAQNYCRVTYTDLATVVSDSDWLRFKNEAANKHLAANAWVGLYNDINSWRWSLNDLPLKNVTYSCWVSGQPDNLYGNEACGIIGYYNAWWDVPCAGLRPFICYNANFSGTARFIGITTLLTWPQAQAYCRTHHTDLASALNSSDNNMLVQIRNIQGDSWIGLYRDTWKWSDGTIASNLLWYPGQPDNYGGVENCAVVYNGLFYDAPCANLYYFFCHSNEAETKRKRQVGEHHSDLEAAARWKHLPQDKGRSVTSKCSPPSQTDCKLTEIYLTYNIHTLLSRGHQMTSLTRSR
ncbi:putative C-type lectin domain family 20 member A [Hemibagrus wyckioides]|uniref:putative C-type lectin domain family 20 member A n=1 Tax=Hemibagrus wyckioides TaxID=337641 RepID=UPI00266C0D6E|nr:putative C-type lectin domain family 20 member A [Hemibagrus wyckioides]